MDNDKQKENKENTLTKFLKAIHEYYIFSFIFLFALSIIIFAIIYFLHSKNIENRFNNTLQNYEKSMSAIFNNMVITNGNNENINTNSFQTNNIENLKLSFEVGFKMLESSMNEIIKNSNDILQFWFAFLSVIMVIFTLAGSLINNNMLNQSREQLRMVEKEARTSRKNIKKETKRLIEENNKKIQENNLFNFGIQAANDKDYKSAIDYFTEVIKLNHKNYQAYNNRGLAKYYLKDYGGAIEDYDKAIELNSNYSIAYNNRGLAKYDLKDYERAIEDYNKAIELNNNYSIAYNNRGIVKHDLGNINEAIKDYNKAIELNPNFTEAFYNRGLAKLELKENEGAIKDFIKSYELDNDNEAKENSKNELINLARKGYNEAREFCRKYNINWD